MILYSVTCLVEEKINNEWLEWMKNEHLPEVMATNLFVEYKFYKIDPHHDDDSGISYSIQYTLETREHYHIYANDHGPQLKAKTASKFGDSVVAFRTILEEI